MLSINVYGKLYRLSAWYDLIVSWPFALAATLSIVWGSVLTPVNELFGFPPIPELGVHAILFGNFFGSVVVIWALVRLYLNDLRLAVFDGIGRMLFSLAMINALLSGATPLIWGFLVPEIIFGIVQLIGTPHLFVRRNGV